MKLASRLRRMNIADTRLGIPLQFIERYPYAFSVRLTYSKVAADKRGERNRLRCRKCRIPSGAMFYARDLFAVFVFVGSRRLVLNELQACLWVLALAESSEVFRANSTAHTPHSLSKRTMPLAVRLSFAGPVILLF